MMHMTFYWGIYAVILFDSWRTKTRLEYALSLVALFLLAVFREFLVSCRLNLAAGVYKWCAAATPERSSLLGKSSKVQKSILCKSLEAVLYLVDVGVAYLLMLSVMSYNGGVFIAVVLGFFAGYLIFRDSSAELLTDAQSCGCA